MKSKANPVAGALHPVLFFAGVYVVVLLFSIFICSTIFYSCHSSSNVAEKQVKEPAETINTTSIATIR
ncbi:MAG: hypothetical protein C4308_04180 [Chitinophagaceae bacterium]